MITSWKKIKVHKFKGRNWLGPYMDVDSLDAFQKGEVRKVLELETMSYKEGLNLGLFHPKKRRLREK